MGRRERAKLLRNSLNLRVLNPEALHDEPAVRLALEQLANVVALSRTHAEAVLTEALGHPNALPYLISGKTVLPDDVMCAWMMEPLRAACPSPDRERVCL